MPTPGKSKAVRKIVDAATEVLADGLGKALRRRLNGKQRRSPRRQAGALPYRGKDGQLQVLLITRRSHDEWIVPKGQVDPGHTEPESALQEAEEEAGVTGSISNHPAGTFRYQKVGRTLTVAVYDLRVERQLRAWPEQFQRERRWLTVSEAADLVSSPGLARILRGLPDRVAVPDSPLRDSEDDN